MRTTLDIEDDILLAAKDLARQRGTTAGRVLSELARRGLTARPSSAARRKTRSGVPLIRSRGDVVTVEKIEEIADHEGV